MRDGWWNGKPQKMNFALGIPKGMRVVLKERGIDTSKMNADMMQEVLGNHHFNSLTAGSIYMYMYICTMNRSRIAACSALHIYVKGTSPTLLESAFDTLSPSASGLGIRHTRTKI